MDPKNIKYDQKSRTLTYSSGLSGKSLLAKELGLELSALARAGSWDDKSVSAVVVDFADEACATYNADAMKYLGISAAVGGVGVSSDAKFTTREDFGIK